MRRICRYDVQYVQLLEGVQAHATGLLLWPIGIICLHMVRKRYNTQRLDRSFLCLSIMVMPWLSSAVLLGELQWQKKHKWQDNEHL
jgi:hypothetical protein